MAASVAHNPDPELEPDNSLDTDSTYGSSISDASLTTSITSSVRAYRREHGRTYNAFKPGVYEYPNDEGELERLDLQHAMFQRLYDNKLFLAPLKDPQSILDVGTGTGIWAIAVAEQFPGANVIGIDLSPVQPDWVPPNVQFEVDNMNDDWVFSRKFDFVHSRQLHMAVEEKKYFKQAHEALQPGGWLEVEEIGLPWRSDDGTLDGTSLDKWAKLLHEAGTKMRLAFDNPSKYKGWMKEIGFQNVQEVVYKMPQNTWPKDPKMKQIGLWQSANFLEGLEGFSLVMLINILGWKREEVDVLLAGVMKDIRNRQIHGYCKSFTCFGQKPEKVLS